jgi:capsular polysaccharide biosynthesis protein
MTQERHAEVAGGPREWRRDIGRIAYFNATEGVAPAPIEDIPRTAEIVRNGFISAREIHKDDGDAGRHALGAVYDGNGNLLPEFRARDERFRDRFTPGQNPLAIGRSRLAAAERLRGRHVYLGDLKGHFGHFLVESLARAWYLVEADARASVVFHHRGVTRFHLAFWQDVFDALDLDLSRVTFANRDLVADELVLPSCQYWNGWKASPGLCVVFDHVRRRIAERWTGGRDFPKKVYLTRRQYRKSEQRLSIAGRHPKKVRGTYARMIGNEEIAEEIFAARGFAIMAPETVPFHEQVMMMSRATHVAGASGSAMHMILFNGNPDAEAIVLNTRASGNQIWIETLRGIRAYHIWCVKHRDENGVPFIDREIVERALHEIL